MCPQLYKSQAITVRLDSCTIQTEETTKVRPRLASLAWCFRIRLKVLQCCWPIFVLLLWCAGCSPEETKPKSDYSSATSSINPSTNVKVLNEVKQNHAKDTSDVSVIKHEMVKRLPKELGPLYRNMSPKEKELAAEIFSNVLPFDDYQTATSNLLDKLEKATSPESLQEWALKRIQQSAGRTNDSTLWEGIAIPFEEIPSGIGSLAPTNTFVGAAVERQPPPDHVVIAWGSGMGGFYGIMVGDSSFRPPTGRGYSTNWQEGIYVWHSSK